MDALRRVSGVLRTMLFTLEGWVGLILSAAVGTILAAVSTQVFRLRVGPAIAFGIGVGLLALAAFVWFVLVLRRDRRGGQSEQEVTLRNSVKQHLRALARQGEGYVRSVPHREQLRRWSRDVENLIHDAFGPDVARQFEEDVSIREFVDLIWEFSRTSAETLPLRPTYRGFRRSV